MRDGRGRIVENARDNLYDFDGPLYRGEDGNMYAMKKVYSGDDYLPLCWQRLTLE